MARNLTITPFTLYIYYSFALFSIRSDIQLLYIRHIKLGTIENMAYAVVKGHLSANSKNENVLEINAEFLIISKLLSDLKELT